MEEQVRLLPVANVVSARLTDSQAEEDQKMQAMVSNAKKVSSRFLERFSRTYPNPPPIRAHSYRERNLLSLKPPGQMSTQTMSNHSWRFHVAISFYRLIEEDSAVYWSP